MLFLSSVHVSTPLHESHIEPCGCDASVVVSQIALVLTTRAQWVAKKWNPIHDQVFQNTDDIPDGDAFFEAMMQWANLYPEDGWTSKGAIVYISSSSAPTTIAVVRQAWNATHGCMYTDHADVQGVIRVCC